MRTCSSVANLDRFHDELDLLDDYEYEGEVLNESARSSNKHSFSGGVSPHRKQINSKRFHQEIVQNAVKKINRVNLEAELSKNSKNNNFFSDVTSPETSNTHRAFTIQPIYIQPKEQTTTWSLLTIQKTVEALYTHILNTTLTSSHFFYSFESSIDGLTCSPFKGARSSGEEPSLSYRYRCRHRSNHPSAYRLETGWKYKNSC